MYRAKRGCHRNTTGCYDDGDLTSRPFLAGTGISSWSCISPVRAASVDRLLDIMLKQVGKRPTDPNLQVE
jgi:hypothetical protein